MEQVKVKAEGLIDHVESLSETYVKLVVANAAQKGVVIAAGVINAILISLFTVFVLLFAAAGLAWWLGDLLNNRAAGFFIVAGVFALIIFLIIVFQKKSIFPLLKNMIVRKLYE